MKLFNIKTVAIVILFALAISCTTRKEANKEEVQTTQETLKVLTVGDKIPSILGYDQDSVLVKASDFEGKKLVIYFYPKDETPGCTTQACNFRDNYNVLLAEGYTVIGISSDDVASHKKFIENHKLPFSLVADTDKKLIKEFGAYTSKITDGTVREIPSRTTYIIDENGTITEIILPEQVDVKNHTIQILDLEKQNG